MFQGDGSKIEGGNGADGLGRGQSPATPMVQLAAGQAPWSGSMGGGAVATAGPDYHAPVPAHRKGMQFRRNVEVPLDKVSEAVLKHVIEEAARDSRDLGSHLHRRATIFYLDANGQSVPIDHVVVAIEE